MNTLNLSFGRLRAVAAVVLSVALATTPAVAASAAVPPLGSDAPFVVSATQAAANETGRALWQWPVHPPPVVTRAFDLAHRYARGHRGIDLAVAPGTQIRAPADGTVYFVGRVVDRNVVSIQHANGIRSTFEPVDAVVSVGDAVTAGTVIGTLATDTIHVPNGGLHLGARIGDDYCDPLLLLQRMPPAILLPLSS